MRRFGIGLLLAVTALMAASSSYAKDSDSSAKDLPPVIAAGKIPCTVTGSRFIAQGAMADKTEAKFYEASCQEGLGLIIIAPTKNPPAPSAFDCITANQPGPDGKKGSISCTLPANTKDTAQLQPIVAKIGTPCTVVKVRVIGSSTDKSYFEAACDGGTGYVLQLPRMTDGPAPAAFSCLDMDPKSNVSCTLTDRDALITANATKLLAASGKTCALKDKRYVGETTDKSSYYEVACQAGDGYMIQAGDDGSFKTATGCALAANLLGGCTLTDARAAQTAQNKLYTSLSKSAGFACDVSKYAAFPSSGDNEVVELQCSNRPDGGVGLFPLKGGKPQVYDCVRSENFGYRCSFSSKESLYAKLSAQLVSKGKGSCVVNGARAFGATNNTDLVEVACADGGSGWVIEYPKTATAPLDLLNCAQAASAGAGGCQLPTNKKK